MAFIMFFKIRTTSIITFLVLFFSQINVFASSDSLIALAGDQRMHVQLLAKDYFYVHGDVLAHKAAKNLKQEYRVFVDNNEKLKKLIRNTEHKGVMSLVGLLEEEFVGFLKAKEYDIKDAAVVLEVSEALSEVYDDIVKKELKKNKSPEIKFLDLLEQQAMVLEKMAKYYVAYTMGVNDYNTLQSIKNSVKEFDANHRSIIKQKSKLPNGIKDLKKISKTWKTMKGYYAGIEESQLPAMALITTDRILKSLTNLIDMYAKQEGI